MALWLEVIVEVCVDVEVEAEGRNYKMTKLTKLPVMSNSLTYGRSKPKDYGNLLIGKVD